FFFSSRRRHTRFSRDWSSDVCSSDLIFLLFGVFGGLGAITAVRKYVRAVPYFQRDLGGIITYTAGEGIARHFRQLDALAEQRGEIGRASCRERVKSGEGAAEVEETNE